MESDQNQPSKNTKPVSTIEPVVEYSYLKDWTPEYLASAEFELVVQKELLPVHKSVMGLSPVFQKELFKTESKKSVLNAALKKKDGVPVSTRLQLSSPLFLDVTVSDMCLLLSHVYATEATLSAERLHELRKLFYLTEEFGFPTITRRCVNFIRHTENLSSGIESDLEEHGATAASEWLELAVKWNFDSIKDDICKFAGEHFFEVFGREEGEEADKKWADLAMTLESNLELWKRTARSLAFRIEAGPSLASLISDEPSTTLIYGVLIGIFAGCILPSWMFFLILIGTVWYIAHKMPPALTIVIQKTVEGAIHGIMHGDKKTDGTAQVELRNQEPKAARHHGKPPALRRAAHVTA